MNAFITIVRLHAYMCMRIEKASVYHNKHTQTIHI
jgi:hypothetical protein